MSKTKTSLLTCAALTAIASGICILAMPGSVQAAMLTRQICIPS